MEMTPRLLDPNTVDLPKWPQMRVIGRGISAEQAAEIIVRTDRTFANAGRGGNNDRFERALARQLNLPYYDYNNYQEALPAWREFRDSIGYLETNYVHNDWISSCFIGGPYGWCHPSGRVMFAENVGKWPSMTEIIDDWKTIAAAWPFLDIDVSIMSGESCEDDTWPLAALCVQSGEVTCYDPNTVQFGSRFSEDVSTVRPYDIETVIAGFARGDRRENTFAVEQIVDMVNRVRQQLAGN